MDEAEIAIALRYDPEEEGAPRVTATGRGPVARQIMEVASAHGVTVQRDRALAELLAPLEVNTPIPVAAFAAVAEILVHLYRADRLAGPGTGS